MGAQTLTAPLTPLAPLAPLTLTFFAPSTSRLTSPLPTTPLWLLHLILVHKKRHTTYHILFPLRPFSVHPLLTTHPVPLPLRPVLPPLTTRLHWTFHLNSPFSFAKCLPLPQRNTLPSVSRKGVNAPSSNLEILMPKYSANSRSHAGIT